MATLRDVLPRGMRDVRVTEVGRHDGLATVEGRCRVCEQHQSVCLPAGNYTRFLAGAAIQDALGMLSVEQRELLLSGTCPECWAAIFGSDSDDEDSEGRQ